jgi:hypothetical protein
MADTHAAHWYSETPILVEALAATIHTTPQDVCEQLQANATTYRPDSVAVMRFIDDYVAAG